MQTVKQTSPYIRKDVSTKRMMTDVLIALIPVVIFAIYRFKWDAAIRIIVSLVVMIGLEAVSFAIMQKPKKDTKGLENIKSRFEKYTINNVITPAISGLIFAMLLPSKLPIYAVVIGAAVGIVIGKMMFGGLGSNIFNPAAVGRIFITLALTPMFTGTYVGVDLVAGGTILTSLGTGLPFPEILNSYSLLDMFVGFIPGAMGEISALAILIGGAYLLIRRSADYRVVVSSVLTFVFLILLAGIKLYPGDVINYVLLHLLSGGLLFGFVFMITDPVTSPVTRFGRVFYGVLVAVVVVLIRLFGSYPEGVAFAILFMNMFVPLIDYPTFKMNKARWPHLVTLGVLILIFGLVVYFGVGGSL
jgi:electron transport complex protein RnfD